MGAVLCSLLGIYIIQEDFLCHTQLNNFLKWTAEYMSFSRQKHFVSSSCKSNSYSSRSKSSSKAKDEYNAKDYYHAEDFYEDHYDDFFDYEDAEDYYNDHYDDW